MLAVLLLVLEPSAFALWASGRVASLVRRGPGEAAILAMRTAVAGLGVAAGLALLGRRPSAPALAKAALLSAWALAAVQLLTRWLPANVAPGDEAPRLAALSMYYGGWLLYLVRSRRVRATFG